MKKHSPKKSTGKTVEKPLKKTKYTRSSGNKYQWQDDWDLEEQGYLNEVLTYK